MPNYVHHDLHITGPETERARFMEECFSEGESDLYLDFDRILPMPARIEKSMREASVRTGEPCTDDLPDWYDWCIKHWGTKWNACDTQVKREGEMIDLRFATAWSIPWPIDEEFADLFPQLTIEGEIFELMMQFGGHIRCHAGNVIYEDKSEQIEADMAEFFANEEKQCHPLSAETAIRPITPF